ncbi:MAG: hypothetical protein JW786_03220 [Desulfobacterales bacterium]|nr:hypothetical protein [Desulfobacterales bacterium]
MAKNKFYKHKFDFEIGYLIKSPCKECSRRKNFPKCADECEMLNKIQTFLAQGVSCTRNFSASESFTISYRDIK